MYEPVILELKVGWPNPAALVANRQDLWESREQAEKALRRSLRKWDRRVVDRYLEFGLRPVPTRLYNQDKDPQLPSSAVTLTTTKHQEAWTYSTPNLEPESPDLDRLLLPDWDPKTERYHSFARPECLRAMRNLPFIRPSVLYVFGSKSYVSLPQWQEERMTTTGTGIGGSGGAAKGMVEKVVFEGASHTLVYEEIDRSAEVAADWLRRWFQGWLADEKLLAEHQSKKSDPDMVKLSEASLKVTRMKAGSKRPQAKL